MHIFKLPQTLYFQPTALTHCVPTMDSASVVPVFAPRAGWVPSAMKLTRAPSSVYLAVHPTVPWILAHTPAPARPAGLARTVLSGCVASTVGTMAVVRMAHVFVIRAGLEDSAKAGSATRGNQRRVDNCNYLFCRCKLHGQCKNGTCLCVTGWNGRHCTIEGCPAQCSSNGECRSNFHGSENNWRLELCTFYFR